MTEKDYNKISEGYWKSQHAYNYLSLCPNRYKKQIALAKEHVVPHLQPTDRVVDLGCADGWFTLFMAPFVTEIDAYDLSTKFIQLAQEKAANSNIQNVHFSVADAAQVQLEGQEYEHAIATGLFTCIFEDETVSKIARQMASCLPEGGLLVLKDSLHISEDLIYETPNYCAKYRAKENYVRLLENAGFQLVHEELLDPKVLDTGAASYFMVMKRVA